MFLLPEWTNEGFIVNRITCVSVLSNMSNKWGSNINSIIFTLFCGHGSRRDSNCILLSCGITWGMEMSKLCLGVYSNYEDWHSFNVWEHMSKLCLGVYSNYEDWHSFNVWEHGY